MSFSATTYNAIKIKALIETLFQNVNELNLLIDNDGIKSFPISSHQPNSMLIFQRDCLMNIHLLFYFKNLLYLNDIFRKH